MDLTQTTSPEQKEGMSKTATLKRPGRTKAEQRAASLEQILDAAEYLFSKHGLYGVTLRDVAERVGIHTTLLHYYFKDKTNLFEEVFARRAPITSGRRMVALEQYEAQAGDKPTVDAVGSAGMSQNSGYGVVPGNTKNASIGVQLNWPLYTGGSVQNRIKETLSLEEQSVNNLEAARRGVAQGTRTAFFGVQSGMAQVKALEAAEVSSKLALDATKLGYEVGVRVNLDVLNAQTKLYTTQRDLAKARYDVLVGGLKLRQAAGTLTAEDVASVNLLLAK